MTTVEAQAPGTVEAAPPPPALVFRNVEKRFWRNQALAGVSFELPPGVIVGLVGTNGSGKSTLLKLAAGLLRPTRGEIRIFGHPPGRATKGRVAYVPEVDPLFPWMTVRETMRFTQAFFADWEPERAEELLDILELPESRRVGELSKGMRTRLRLLLALARSAPLVLLDEPLSGIDPPSRSRIVEGILATHRQGQRTMVLSTHDLKSAEPLFDRLLVLAAGRVRLDGDVEELRQERGQSIETIVEEALA